MWNNSGQTKHSTQKTKDIFVLAQNYNINYVKSTTTYEAYTRSIPSKIIQKTAKQDKELHIKLATVAVVDLVKDLRVRHPCTAPPPTINGGWARQLMVAPLVGRIMTPSISSIAHKFPPISLQRTCGKICWGSGPAGSLGAEDGWPMIRNWAGLCQMSWHSQGRHHHHKPQNLPDPSSVAQPQTVW